jgi:arabinose-5-phosphate isomerase
MESLTLENVLQTIETGNLGFCLVVDDNGVLNGLISSADIRKALLRNLEDFNKIQALDLINTQPITISEENTVVEMLQKIKRCTFSVMYLPVVKNGTKASGIVNFTHLIKAEL